MNRFRLYQDGLMVAAGECEDWDRLTVEALHYLSQYAIDGPDKFRLVLIPAKKEPAIPNILK